MSRLQYASVAQRAPIESGTQTPPRPELYSSIDRCYPAPQGAPTERCRECPGEVWFPVQHAVWEARQVLHSGFAGTAIFQYQFDTSHSRDYSIPEADETCGANSPPPSLPAGPTTSPHYSLHGRIRRPGPRPKVRARRRDDCLISKLPYGSFLRSTP